MFRNSIVRVERILYMANYVLNRIATAFIMMQHSIARLRQQKLFFTHMDMTLPKNYH